MVKRKISSLEYKLCQIFGRHDLIEDSVPRTRLEEEQAADDSLREQLGTFKNATTGEPLPESMLHGVVGSKSN